MTPEAKVRDPVVKWAKANGIGHIRLSFRPGVTVGWPDDLFLIPGGVTVMLEFKRPGKVPTPIQLNKLTAANKLGFACGWFDDSRAAIVFLGAVAAKMAGAVQQ